MVHWNNRGGIDLFLLPDSPGWNGCKEIADRFPQCPAKSFAMVFDSGKAGYFSANGI